jgi:hypothetical protein
MHTEYFTSKRQSYSQARRHPRLPADFPVLVRSSELRVDDRVTDLSEAGIGVATHRPLSPMQLVSMRLQLPQDGEAVEVLGRVMWATGHRMGIRFEQADARVTDAVARLRQSYERF